MYMYVYITLFSRSENQEETKHSDPVSITILFHTTLFYFGLHCAPVPISNPSMVHVHNII